MNDSHSQHPPPALSRRRLSPPVTRRPGSPVPPPSVLHWHTPLHQEPTLTGAGEQHSCGTASPLPPHWLLSAKPALPAPPPPDSSTNREAGRGSEPPIGGSRQLPAAAIGRAGSQFGAAASPLWERSEMLGPRPHSLPGRVRDELMPGQPARCWGPRGGRVRRESCLRRRGAACDRRKPSRYQ